MFLLKLRILASTLAPVYTTWLGVIDFYYIGNTFVACEKIDGTTEIVEFNLGSGVSSISIEDLFGVIIDDIPIAAADAIPSVSSADAGDNIALTFTEAVANKSSISTAIEAATDTYGSSASTAWSNSDKTVTITLGSGEDVEDGTVLTISSVQDAAGNESDIIFMLDIS